MTHILGSKKFERICRACAVELDFDQATMAVICRPEVLELLQQMGAAA